MKKYDFLVASMFGVFLWCACNENKSKPLDQNTEIKNQRTLLERGLPDGFDFSRDTLPALLINLGAEIDKISYLKKWMERDFWASDSGAVVNQLFITEIDKPNQDYVVYNMKLNAGFPNCMNRLIAVIYFKTTGLSYILPIEINQVFLIENTFMFGGFEENREFEYYRIYELNETNFSLVLQSYQNGNITTGYFRDDYHLEYLPNRLNFKYDGKNEIQFLGEICFYCDSRCSRISTMIKPIEKKKVKIIYNYVAGKWVLNSKTKYPSWEFHVKSN